MTKDKQTDILKRQRRSITWNLTIGNYGEKIRDTVGTQQAFADVMGYSRVTISSKLNGRVPWTQADIVNAAEILGNNRTMKLPIIF